MTGTTTDGVHFERIGPVARIVLDRPDRGNAIDVPMARALMRVTIACDEADDVRCVLLTGRGKMFCAGGDVGAFAEAGNDVGAFLKEITTYLHAAVSRLARMNKPLVTAVNGSAAGAGLGLAILGDIVLAAPQALFTLAYPGIGLSPDGGSSWLLPRLIGLRRAQDFCLRNRRIRAEEAMSIGLITRVAADGALDREAETLAGELAGGPTAAFGATRRLLLESSTNSLETHLDLESRAIATQGRHTHGREGVQAFIAKRSPVFEGD